MSNFEWNFTQPLSMKMYILSPNVVEIYLKMTISYRLNHESPILAVICSVHMDTVLVHILTLLIEIQTYKHPLINRIIEDIINYSNVFSPIL